MSLRPGRFSGFVLPLVVASAAYAGDFKLNTFPLFPSYSIGQPTIAKGPAGDYLAVYSINGDQLRMRRFGIDGLPLGDDFSTYGYGLNAALALLPGGGWITASDYVLYYPFQGAHDDPRANFADCITGYGVSNPDGTVASSGILTHSHGELTCVQGVPSVAVQADGNAVIVFVVGPGDGSPVSLNAVRVPSAGNLPAVITSFTGVGAARVAAGPAGELAVSWIQPAGSGDVMLRLFAPDGTPQGAEFVASQMAVADPSYPPRPALALGTQGTLMVAWHAIGSFGDDTLDESIQGRVFDSSGVPLGPQFQLNSLTPGAQAVPRLAALPGGGYLAVWESQASNGTDADGYSIQARQFLADGTPSGPEYQVNALETGDQRSPDVAVDAAGIPTFVWTSPNKEIRASDDRTDLAITVTDNASTTQPGATLQYVVTVTENGPADGPGAVVTDMFPADLTCTWTCVGSDGATCAAGSHPGDIDDTASVPVGGAATYTAACLVGPGASGDLVNTAAVAAPAGLNDTNLANNTATDTTGIPSFFVDDVQVDEGNAGVTLASFNVRLVPASATPATVDFATGDGTATSGSDYLSAAGTLSFAPGETIRTVDASVLGDTIFEADETFFVTLSNATGAAIADGLAVGTIVNDDSGLPSGSLDELVHGSSEVRSLESAPGPAPVAQYWRVQQQALSSYEVVVDGTSGDLGSQGPALDRVASDGTIVQHATGGGAARSLRWESAGSVSGESIRVQSRGCIDDCDAADVFRVRMWETTAFASRFNNSATQITVLLVQNGGADPVTGNVHFTDSAGTLLLSQPFAVPARGTLAMNTAVLLPGASGAVRVASDAAYGMLQGKAVAVEPATGFTFDTPLVPRPR